MRIASFNVQNLRLRRRNGEAMFDGARDGDDPSGRDQDEERRHRMDALDRELTAQLIVDSDADIIALQEVFDQQTLDAFHEAYLAPRGGSWPYRFCLEGNDGRSIDIAVMSRLPLEAVTSHAELRFSDVGAASPTGTPSDARVFRRDCLAFQYGDVHFFVCHLKTAVIGDERARQIRRAEALAIRHVVQQRVANAAQSHWVVLGDFNAHKAVDEADLTPLFLLGATDICKRISDQERWTYFHQATEVRSCPDRIFMSPAMSEVFASAVPVIMRQGMGQRTPRHIHSCSEGVGDVHPHASDHALMYVDLNRDKAHIGG